MAKDKKINKTKEPVIILESSLYFEKGKIIEKYKNTDGGIIINEHFVPKSQFVRLNEQLSIADEKRVKELIRSQLKYLFWQLYTKQSIMLGNI